ncbi:hypothetical protein [Alicyclobacillus mengziensis]|uniref:Uncharacterized protein n=1 Tax=Alicyclobacillus mengziensis TaxID=2931921 RepID=A0A9X7W2B7_9BACL|nr:hypothetical protein [Alicyclobacillus mengziensis]QSO49416.1 hypothetical protein JZ786_11115 [Alicyclobacillus mengziensis]
MDTNSRAETRLALYQLITDVVDTVATFDGRFSYTPTNSSGECLVTFATSSLVHTIRLTATVTEPGDVTVKFTDEGAQPSDGSGSNEVQQPSSADGYKSKILYAGPYRQSEIYQYVGAGLANWYGQTVRSQS